jgi:phage terminase large subunit GpA-like protein
MIGYNYSDQIIQAFKDGLKPTPLLTCSEWSDANRFLSSESSSSPGRWRTERTPYLRKILDCLSPTSTYKEVIAQKASQQGFSEAGLNALGTYMDISPCPIMYIMPTVNMAKGFSKSRLQPMIDMCPNLNAKVKPSRERDANNTVLEKSFAGGIVILTGANSAAELSSRPIRVLIMDEVDRYPINVDNEGSPMELAKKRTITFSNKKIFILSTPTITGQSAIETEIEKTDKQKYFVNLPCCEGGGQALEFEGLKWEAGKPHTVKYECAHCGALIDERHKAKFLLEKGFGGTAEWLATEPELSRKDVIGFIINGLYSPLGWLSWKQIVEEYEIVKDDPVKLRTFVNTVLGLSFAEKTDTPPWENLYNRREKYDVGSVAEDVVFITMGADVQRDRIEAEVVGWCEGKRSYSIEYLVFNGDTSNKKVWDEFAQHIDKHYEKEDGTILPIRLTAIDTGYNTTEVYTFCRRFDPSRVIPVKGQDKQVTTVRTPTSVDVKQKDGRKVGTIKLWHVGVSVVKSELYGWMRQEKIETEIPNGYMHFPEYNAEYFKGMTAERLTLKVVRGYKQYVWEKHYDRNEPLDCRVYARAAAAVLGMDRLSKDSWQKLRDKQVNNKEKNIKPAQVSESQQAKKKVKKVKRSNDFW